MTGLVYVFRYCDQYPQSCKAPGRTPLSNITISPISVLINLLIISTGQDASGVRAEVGHQAPSEYFILEVCTLIHGLI